MKNENFKLNIETHKTSENGEQNSNNPQIMMAGKKIIFTILFIHRFIADFILSCLALLYMMCMKVDGINGNEKS